MVDGRVVVNVMPVNVLYTEKKRKKQKKKKEKEKYRFLKSLSPEKFKGSCRSKYCRSIEI